MEENLTIAIQLLIIGMISVFMVLGLVVLLGRTLIFFINKFHQEQTPLNQLNKKTLAAIISTVEVISAGKAKIESIEKI